MDEHDEGSPEVVTLFLIPPAVRALDEATALSGDDQATIANRALQMYAYLLMERSVGHHIALLERTQDRINIYEIRFNDDPDFHDFSVMAQRGRDQQMQKERKPKVWKRALRRIGMWP